MDSRTVTFIRAWYHMALLFWLMTLGIEIVSLSSSFLGKQWGTPTSTKRGWSIESLASSYTFSQLVSLSTCLFFSLVVVVIVSSCCCWMCFDGGKKMGHSGWRCLMVIVIFFIGDEMASAKIKEEMKGYWVSISLVDLFVLICFSLPDFHLSLIFFCCFFSIDFF